MSFSNRVKKHPANIADNCFQIFERYFRNIIIPREVNDLAKAANVRRRRIHRICNQICDPNGTLLLSRHQSPENRALAMRQRRRGGRRRRGESERGSKSESHCAVVYSRDARRGVGAIMEAWIFMETRAPCNLYETQQPRDVTRLIGAARMLHGLLCRCAELNYPRARTRNT